MKNIDVKSLLIGILATALLFACADADKTSPSIVSEAKAATGTTDKWDDKQEWEAKSVAFNELPQGWEPFAPDERNHMWIRKRIK